MKKIIGAIFILIACILYSTDRITFYLSTIALSNLGVSTKQNFINDTFTIVLAVIFAIVGIVILLMKDTKE
jgi:hypothetical protein